MTIYILTLFPKTFESVFLESIIKRAQEKKIVKIKIVNIRDFASDKHKSVDDKPYGGGAGMILKADVIIDALESIKSKPYSLLLSAAGKTFNQKLAKKFSQKKSLAIICGHYEGVDARVNDLVDEVISIGDFVLTGGEIAAMVIIDSTVRLIPNVIRPRSLNSESFSNLSTPLEYPQYTRPEEFKGKKVPSILLKGNHLKIDKWRKQQATTITKKIRPDLT